MSARDIVKALGGRWEGSSGIAKCPAHDDKNPSPDDVDKHPQRHLVTRTLGLGPVDVESDTLSLEEGDRLVFCSDGLTSMVNDDDILRIVTAGDDPEATVWSLIEAANSAGGVDNITVAMVDARA